MADALLGEGVDRSRDAHRHRYAATAQQHAAADCRRGLPHLSGARPAVAFLTSYVHQRRCPRDQGRCSLGIHRGGRRLESGVHRIFRAKCWGSLRECCGARPLWRLDLGESCSRQAEKESRDESAVRRPPAIHPAVLAAFGRTGTPYGACRRSRELCTSLFPPSYVIRVRVAGGKVLGCRSDGGGEGCRRSGCRRPR
jgi:hypothetical protein